MKKLLLLFLLFSIAACAQPIKRVVEPPPANLTASCPEPPLLPSKANMGDLLAADIELAGMYRECAERHAGLSAWAKSVTE